MLFIKIFNLENNLITINLLHSCWSAWRVKYYTKFTGLVCVIYSLLLLIWCLFSDELRICRIDNSLVCLTVTLFMPRLVCKGTKATNIHIPEYKVATLILWLWNQYINAHCVNLVLLSDLKTRIYRHYIEDQVVDFIYIVYLLPPGWENSGKRIKMW